MAKKVATHEDAVKVMDKAYEIVLAKPQAYRPGSEGYSSDYWANSTKVTGIRTLRVRVFVHDQALVDGIVAEIKNLLANLPEGSWAVSSYSPTVWDATYTTKLPKARNNVVTVWYTSDSKHY